MRYKSSFFLHNGNYHLSILWKGIYTLSPFFDDFIQSKFRFTLMKS
jgi:hypothetical protein